VIGGNILGKMTEGKLCDPGLGNGRSDSGEARPHADAPRSSRREVAPPPSGVIDSPQPRAAGLHTGVAAVIVGRSLYEGTLTLKVALAAAT